jgi:hypothetical protein
MSGHFRRFALRPLDGVSCEPLSDGRYFHGDPERLGFCRSPTRLRFSFCCFAQGVFLGFRRLPLCLCVGFCCLTPSFGLCLGGSPRLGFCRPATSFRLCFGGAALFFLCCFALRVLSGLSTSFRFGSSALRFLGRFMLRLRFRYTSRLGFCCLTPRFCLRILQASRFGLRRLAPSFCFGRLAMGLRLGSAALCFFGCYTLRCLSGLSPSFSFRGSALCFFGRFTLRFRFRGSP